MNEIQERYWALQIGELPLRSPYLALNRDRATPVLFISRTGAQDYMEYHGIDAKVVMVDLIKKKKKKGTK